MPSAPTTPTRLLGLDLGGTNIKSAVVEAHDEQVPEVSSTGSMPTFADGGPEAVTERILELGRAAMSESGPVEAVGVGVPGLFDFETGEIVFFTNLPGPWEGFPLRARIADGLGVPATLINDARAFTLAESRVGAGRGCDTVACITLGTGVGGGLVIGGELHFGAYGVGGEIGHQTVAPSGPVCGCGNQGCLEAVTRAGYIAGEGGKGGFDELMEGLARGEDAPRRAIDTMAWHMGIGLGNILTVVGPERIVIGGGVAEAGEAIIGRIRAAVRERVTLVPPGQVEVVEAELGPIAGAVGAALAALGSPGAGKTFLEGEIPSARLRRSGAGEAARGQ